MQHMSIYIRIYIYIYIYWQDTAKCLDLSYNYVYVIEKNNSKINMIEQNEYICNILQFYRSYKIIDVIKAQFLRYSLQFVANAYKDNMINEWDYTYWQVTLDYIDHIQCRGLGNWIANYSSCNL